MKISFILPVYNVEKYIKQCIDSVLRQTLKDYEIIVVDDGSLDRSIKIVKEIKDSRIKIVAKENGGLSSARNTGLKVAKGDYIAFIDSDDYIGIETAYEDMYNIAINENSEIITGNAIWYFSEENNYPMKRDMSYFSHSPMKSEDYFLGCLRSYRIYVPVWINLYKRDFLIKNDLYFKEGIYHEDQEFTPRALIKANKISIYSKDFYVYRQREGSIMNSGINIKRGLDVLDICLEQEKLIEHMKSEELKILFKNRIAKLCMDQIYMYNLKDVSKNIKELIKRNSICNKYKVKSHILNLNISLFIICEKIIKNKGR